MRCVCVSVMSVQRSGVCELTSAPPTRASPNRFAPLQLGAFASMAHAAAMLGGDVRGLPRREAGAVLHGWYLSLLAAAAAAGGVSPGDASHNLLLTQSFMLVVLRSSRHADAIAPPNALAYAGLLVTKGGGGAKALKEMGPLRVLEACAVRRTAA